MSLGVWFSHHRSFAGEVRRCNGCFSKGVENIPSNENALMISWPPRRALTFPIVSDASQTQHIRLPGESDHRFPSDEELMSRLKSNDASALEILFHRYARLVFRIARGVVRDSGEAEDVVQEAFFHLYKKSILFDGSKGGV